MKINYNFLTEINRPEFQPPDWLFNLVWPALYALMFVSFYIFLNTKTDETKMPGVWLFLIQFCLNFLWVPVFFTFRNIKFAFIVSLLLTLAIICMIIYFCRISILAGLMNLPYLVWVIFADVLNYYLYILNRN